MSQRIILLSGRMRALNHLAKNHPEEYEKLLYEGIKEAEQSMKDLEEILSAVDNTRRETNE